MKRIANKVAVATICYTIKPSQKIKLYDYESVYDLYEHKNSKVVFKGLLTDSYNYKYSKWFDSQCYGLRIEDDSIVFDIVSKNEQY